MVDGHVYLGVHLLERLIGLEETLLVPRLLSGCGRVAHACHFRSLSHGGRVSLQSL